MSEDTKKSSEKRDAQSSRICPSIHLTLSALVRLNLRKTNMLLNPDGIPTIPTEEDFLGWDGSEVLRKQLKLIDKGYIHVLNTLMLNPVDFAPSRFLRKR